MKIYFVNILLEDCHPRLGEICNALSFQHDCRPMRKKVSAWIEKFGSLTRTSPSADADCLRVAMEVITPGLLSFVTRGAFCSRLMTLINGISFYFGVQKVFTNFILVSCGTQECTLYLLLTILIFIDITSEWTNACNKVK